MFTKVATILFFLGVSGSLYAQQTAFHDRVLQDFGNADNTLFLALHVQSEAYNGEVVVTNGYLYQALRKTRRFDKEKYKSFLADILSTSGKLLMPKAVLIQKGRFLTVPKMNSYGLMPVKKIARVEELARRGCEPLVEYYFDGDKMMKPGVSFDERNAVISKLFAWQIPSYISDPAGSLVIQASDREEQSPCAKNFTKAPRYACSPTTRNLASSMKLGSDVKRTLTGLA